MNQKKIKRTRRWNKKQTDNSIQNDNSNYPIKTKCLKSIVKKRKYCHSIRNEWWKISKEKK